MQEARLDECVTLREKPNDIDSARSELIAPPIARIGHVHMTTPKQSNNLNSCFQRIFLGVLDLLKDHV